MAEETKTDLVQQETTPPKPKEKTYSEQEYNALKTQLESLKQSAKDNEDFKKKFEESEKARKDFEYQTKLTSYVKSLGLENDIYEKHLMGLISAGKITFDDGGKPDNAEKIVEDFKKTYPQAFRPSPNERVSAPTGNNTPAMSGVEQAFYSINPNLKP